MAIPYGILGSASQWHLGANDNTIGGWLVVCSYVVLGYLCWREFIRQLSSTGTSGRVLSALFWFVLSVGVTALGINKQLDLQTLIMAAGRRVALTEGVIRYRRLLEGGFFGIILIASVFSAAILWKLGRHASEHGRRVLVGTGLLLGFLIFRAAKIEHVGATITNVPHRLLIVAELAASAFLSLAVWWNSRESRG